MPKTSCIICHHYSEKSGEIPSCDKCHKDKTDYVNLNMPSLKGAYHRQCLACHREWSHKDECQFCHKEIESLDESENIVDKTDIVGTSHPLISAEEKYVYQTSYPKAPIVTFHHTDHVDLFGLNCQSHQYIFQSIFSVNYSSSFPLTGSKTISSDAGFSVLSLSTSPASCLPALI